MVWTAFDLISAPQNNTIGWGPPILASDGNIWFMSGLSSGNGVVTLANTSGWVTNVNIYNNPAEPTNATGQLVTDGTYVYTNVHTLYPRVWACKAAISGHAVTINFLSGGGSQYEGLVLAGTSFVAVGGNGTGGGYYKVTLSTLNLASSGSLTGLTQNAGYSVTDGTNLWAVTPGASTLVKLNLSTLVTTTYTLPTAAFGASNNTAQMGQLGYDGSNIYICAASGGIIVWNIAGASGTVYGSTALRSCYYSSNQSTVVAGDNTTGVVYTMPAGGGTITSIGNLATILSRPNVNIKGFCDGGAGVVWVMGNDGTNSVVAYYYPTTMQFVMLL